MIRVRGRVLPAEGVNISNLRDLFDSHGFRQVPRLIDVASAPHRDVVGEHLQRNDFQQRREQIRRGGNFDHVVGGFRARDDRLR